MTLAGFLTLRKKTAKTAHTHTWFAKGANARGTGTLSLDDKDAGKLRENLVADVSNRDDITTGANSVSEKVTRGAPFRLFADLDFAAEDILAWKTSNDFSPDEFPRRLQDKLGHIVALYSEVVAEAAQSTTNTSFVLTTRLPYKIHLHFPYVIVDAKAAKQLAKTFSRRFQQNHPDLFRETVTDESVYVTGLRLLYCHKGSMGKAEKREAELRVHVSMFGAGSYCDVYYVTDGTTWKQNKIPCVSDLASTSIQVGAGTALTSLTAQPNTLFSVKIRSKGIARPPPCTENRHQAQVAPASELITALSTHFSLSLDEINWSGKSIHSNCSNKVITVPTTSKRCPFAGREHVSNHLYLVLSKNEAQLKCHDDQCTDSKVVDYSTLSEKARRELVALMNEEVTEEMRLSAVNDSLHQIQRVHPQMDVTQATALRTRLGGGDHWMCKLPKNMWCPLHKREHDSASNCIIMTLREQQIMCQLEPELLLELPLLSQYGNVIFGTQIVNNNVNITVNGGNATEISTEGLFDEVYPILKDPELNQLMLGSFNGFAYDIAKVVHHLGRNLLAISNSKKDSWWVWNEITRRWQLDERLAGSFLSVHVAAKYYEARQWFRSNTEDQKLRALRDARIESIIRRLKDKDKRSIMDNVGEVYAAMGEQPLETKMDSDPFVLGFEGEVYDLRSGTRKLAESTDYVSLSTGYKLPVAVDHDIRNALVKTLRDLMPDDAEFEYLLLHLASTLNGCNAEEIFAIWIGDGRNGKGVLQHLVKHTLGQYFVSPSATLLTGERPDSSKPIPDVLNLRGKRVASTSEPEDKKPFNAGFVKWLTGNDPISGCYKHANEEVSFQGQHSIILLCNKIPPVSAKDKAFWRRARVQDFCQVFTENPQPGTNQRKIDITLKPKLELWAPQFMLLLLEYYRIYQVKGLVPTEGVLRGTNMARNDNDPLVTFIEEHYEKTDHETDRIARKTIHDDLKAWCNALPERRELRQQKPQHLQHQLKEVLSTFGIELGEELDDNGKMKVKNKRVGEDGPCPAYSYIKVRSE